MSFRLLSSTVAASGVFLFTSLASALVAPPAGCGTGPACGVGFECARVGASGCAATPCAAGAECPPPEPCATTELWGCVPAHCTVDAECAPGMVCHAYAEPCTEVDCACGDAPDCSCPATTCGTASVSVCTPRYQLPCQNATDCGEGFTCEPQSTGCASAGSGSAGAATPGADAAPAGGAAGLPREPAEPGPTCVPEPSGVLACVPKQIDCQTAGDCPSGWSCQQSVAVSAPACPPAEPCAYDPPELPQAQCQPPYYGGGVGSDGGVAVPTTPGTDNSSSGGDPAPVPQDPRASESSAQATNESVACQFGRAPASSGAVGLLALAGALLGLKRRRRS